MRPSTKLTPNENPSKYTQVGYYIFRQQFTSKEMELYQQTLDSILDCLRLGEKPQFMFEPHVGSQHWRTSLSLLSTSSKWMDAVESVLGSNLVLILSHFIMKGTEDSMNVGWQTNGTGCMRILPGTNQPKLLGVNVKEDDGSTYNLGSRCR